LLLRLLLQRGVPVAAFQELGSLAASIGGGGTAAAVPQSGTSAMDAEVALERLEAEVRLLRLLPGLIAGCQMRLPLPASMVVRPC
jgi:hypothetical protein